MAKLQNNFKVQLHPKYSISLEDEYLEVRNYHLNEENRWCPLIFLLILFFDNRGELTILSNYQLIS